MFDNPALVNFAVISVVSVTINFVLRSVVSAIVVASTVNSIFKTLELVAASFLRAVTSVSFVIFMAPSLTPKYSAIPVLNSALFAALSNSAKE